MSNARNIRNLALIGFMGTGKSSVGRFVADALHFTFLDTDEVIVARAGKSIADIFAQEGEAAFRERECRLVDELAQREKTVIATGGGLPANPVNLASLKTHALLVCLWASPEKIWERVRYSSQRPLLNEPDPLAKIRSLLAAREPFYRQADVLLDAEFRSAREVAQQVVNQFRMAHAAQKMKAAIRQRALDLGFDDCRFTSAAPPASAKKYQDWLNARHHGEMGYLERNAAKRTDPQLVLPGVRSVVALAVSYEQVQSQLPGTPHASRHMGLIARYARFTDYHEVLGPRLKTLTDFVNQLGGEYTRSLWYVDTGPILERDFAQRAGLGFVGKHTNVISRKLGNWIFLTEILTTLELEPDPPEKNRCGSCTRCIEACPTRAITAPFQLDARLCISYLTIELKGSIPVALRPAIGNRIYGCDDCLAACPWNRFAQEGRLMKTHDRSDLATPELVLLLELDEAGFREKFAGTPMLRTKRRGLLRNVCVALGNIGDETALPALCKATTDAEPLIREHAQWAIEQIEARGKSPASRVGSWAAEESA